MAEDTEDPREVPWHPRHAQHVIGHQRQREQFLKAFASGRPHHAWLFHGRKGIGKATAAYHLACQVFGNRPEDRRWIEARAHPDLFVLERQLNDSKPRKLKAEIAVDDARGLAGFLARTAAGAWRVVIVDAADDLNQESGNAILKLVEEPPARTLILLISHQPGRLLRTLKSRCLRLKFDALQDSEVMNIIRDLPLDIQSVSEAREQAVMHAQGSPGMALLLLNSIGAKAFATYQGLPRPKTQDLLAIAAQVAGKGAGPDDFMVFTELLLDWMARAAVLTKNPGLADAHEVISENARIAQGFNLDRKQAVLAQLRLVNDALKAS